MYLKTFAEELSPGIKVTISCPMIRTDNPLANKKLVQVKEMIKKVEGLSIIENDNITKDHLSVEGLHLKPTGTTQLARNMIAFMQNIEQDV